MTTARRAAAVLLAGQHRPFPPETGRLHRLGPHLYDAQGHVWGAHNYTCFMLGGRLWSGESIQPQLRQIPAFGYNTTRIFGPVDWPDPWVQPAFRQTPTVSMLHDLFGQTTEAGIRFEYTPLTHPGRLDDQQAFVQDVYDVAQHYDLAFVECANEPHLNGIDPVAVMNGIDRHGVLSAYGRDPEVEWTPEHGYNIPVLDYVTSHDQARDQQHSPRNSKDCRDMQDVLQVPAWDDEPLGVIDPARFNFHEVGGGIWERPGGGSRRTTNIAITTDHAAVALTLVGHTTYHSQAGLEGRVPGPDEPIQAAGAAQIGSLFGFIVPRAQLGAYTRAGLPDFPIAWTPGDTDSLVQHAYASIFGDEAWVVVPVPSPTWPGFQAVNGWRLEAIGPVSNVAKLVR